MKIAIIIIVGFVILTIFSTIFDLSIIGGLIGSLGFLPNIFTVVLEVIKTIYQLISQHTLIFGIFGVFLFGWIVRIIIDHVIGGKQ